MVRAFLDGAHFLAVEVSHVFLIRSRGNGVSPEEVPPPKVCPACRSVDLTTTGKKATATSYWRCLKCGEVWNQERLGGGRPYVPRRW